jgi:pimeloyl-ACP methyl ester carboxylesterase
MISNEVNISLKGVRLCGQWDLAPQAIGMVVFAHGSGSSRHSPRNQAVARILQKAGLSTLLFDLLTPEEEQLEARNRHLRFNIPLLAQRLTQVTRWALDNTNMAEVPVGYFGSSTGAAAALVSASELGESVGAVVSRGGRPDLAAAALDKVAAPTLLIVGVDDDPVIPLNEQAYEALRCEKALRLIPGASHLFEEPGKLELVADMAADWFVSHLQPLLHRVRRS